MLPGGIRTRNPNQRAATDRRFRPRGTRRRLLGTSHITLHFRSQSNTGITQMFSKQCGQQTKVTLFTFVFTCPPQWQIWRLHNLCRRILPLSVWMLNCPQAVALCWHIDPLFEAGIQQSQRRQWWVCFCFRSKRCKCLSDYFVVFTLYSI